MKSQKGNNLGPILFLIYVNSIFQIFINCNVFMFADEFLILASDDISVAVANFQINLNHLKWTHDNKLMIISKKQICTYTINI
jgi:hypothetical protein